MGGSRIAIVGAGWAGLAAAVAELNGGVLRALVGVVDHIARSALHDVLSALARRAPHVPIVVYPSPVQGADAPAALAAQLLLYRAAVNGLLVVGDHQLRERDVGF